jgi:anti-sigma B factor antagonist
MEGIGGFAVDEQSLDDGTCVVAARGELDFATAPVLGQRVRRLLFWNDATRVIVDLSEISFIDSSGVRALLLSRTHAKSLDRPVLFVCPEGNVLRRVQAYGLAAQLPLYASRDDALAA